MKTTFPPLDTYFVLHFVLPTVVAAPDNDDNEEDNEEDNEDAMVATIGAASVADGPLS